MKARLPVAAALGLGLLGASIAADPPAAKAPTASVREVVYFGPAGPVRIRLNVSLDGRQVDAAWADAIDSLFAFRDRDGDGFLDPAERAPFLPPRRGKDIEFAIDGPFPVQPLVLSFPQKDEKVSRAAFAEAVKTAGRGAIGLRVVASRPDSRQLSAALFRHLDQDGDGRLSADELRAARERLAHLDVDEDEFVTAAELLGRGVGANTGRVRPVLPGTRLAEEPAESSADLVFLTADGAQAVKQLLAARGGPRATSLKPAEFGADAKTFAALDQDGNGVLDTTELTAWLRRPPDLELAVSFDTNGGRLTVIAPASLPAEKNGTVVAALPGGRFRFEPPAGAPTKEWAQAADRLRDQFKELAGKGPVERKQLENQPPALVFFDFADRNGDGKVGAAEVEAARKALAPLAACRVDVAFLDHGNGLFELLDTNGDGRLSPRELVEAVTVLKPYAGPDGRVGPKDLVRRFQVRLVVEPIPVGVLVPPAQPAVEDRGPRVQPPAWFTKMDRNGDGDVSLREFVGPIELFRKLDRNGDGLISPDEALAAGK
jgi:Ca2+-binding EF-hand superfamily protein